MSLKVENFLFGFNIYYKPSQCFRANSVSCANVMQCSSVNSTKHISMPICVACMNWIWWWDMIWKLRIWKFKKALSGELLYWFKAMNHLLIRGYDRSPDSKLWNKSRFKAMKHQALLIQGYETPPDSGLWNTSWLEAMKHQALLIQIKIPPDARQWNTSWFLNWHKKSTHISYPNL